MDTRIEELALIIEERSTQRDADINGDTYQSYRRLESLARDMLEVIKQYRIKHPEKYEDTSLLRSRQQVKDAHEQIVNLRSELRGYREREKTMGWAQD
ncbi:hypothetical protein [Methylibium sp.]|uniref:hypothetical protein n=1 Tax=Methylibium sp. TaxID=2067992 RepID=UPI0017F706AC|nr:hypothetical protein [Methylibium sp.]MBA3588287.1 hypothetical protein [Methylibium sp.]